MAVSGACAIFNGMKKYLILPALAIATLMLAGCKEKTKSDPTTQENAADSVPPSVTEKVDSVPDPVVPNTGTGTSTPVEEKTTEATPPQSKTTSVSKMKADVNAVGEVNKKGDEWVIRVTSPEAVDYLPEKLNDAFMVEGLKVRFTAVLRPIPPGVRMAGKPVSIITISRVQ